MWVVRGTLHGGFVFGTPSETCFFLNWWLAWYAGTFRGYVDVFGCVDTRRLGVSTNFLGGRNTGMIASTVNDG
jgi:hypothetical protein